MINFKDITIQDKDTITSYTMNSSRRTFAVGDFCITPSSPSLTISWHSNSGLETNWPI